MKIPKEERCRIPILVDEEECTKCRNLQSKWRSLKLTKAQEKYWKYALKRFKIKQHIEGRASVEQILKRRRFLFVTFNYNRDNSRICRYYRQKQVKELNFSQVYKYLTEENISEIRFVDSTSVRRYNKRFKRKIYILYA